jgi:transposase
MRNLKEREKMREIKKRKFYTPEFKTQVALEALRGIRTINEIGQEYGVYPVAVGHWKKELQKEAKTLFDGKRGLAPMASHREPKRLCSEIGKLTIELNWLKNSLGPTGDYLANLN